MLPGGGEVSQLEGPLVQGPIQDDRSIKVRKIFVRISNFLDLGSFPLMRRG